MDVRDLAAGTELLPVQVPDAMVSISGTHAAQGDGEVCGTAIEPDVGGALSELVKGATSGCPGSTPGPVSRHFDGEGYEVTTGVGPDLMQAAREAVSGMVDLLSGRSGMRPVEAYMLCSVCADLRVSEIVDVPKLGGRVLLPQAGPEVTTASRAPEARPGPFPAAVAPLLEIDGLEVAFRSGEGESRVVEGVTCGWRPAVLGLVGESGCGRA